MILAYHELNISLLNWNNCSRAGHVYEDEQINKLNGSEWQKANEIIIFLLPV